MRDRIARGAQQAHTTLVMVADLETLLLDECLIALGLRPQGAARRWLRPVLGQPVRRLARSLARFDDRVAAAGPSHAARELLGEFASGLQVAGAEHIPRTGPLLVAANHPGTYDGLALIAALGRDDVRLIASGVDLLRRLPAASRHLIFVAPEAHPRMAAARQLLRHLQAGGAGLLMASGFPDPDPDAEPGAGQALAAWSPSLALALRHAPATRLVVAIVSGVLAPACLRHPLTRLRKVPWERRKLAAFWQVAQQLAFGRDFGLRPRVTFGPARVAAELAAAGAAGLQPAIVELARTVLARHGSVDRPNRPDSHQPSRPPA